MSFLQNNSTNIPLGPNEEFVGEPTPVDKDFVSVQCSFDSNVGGTMEFYHSVDGFSYATYGDSYTFSAGSHSRETSTKGRYFKIRFINGNTAQTSFNLFCKFNRVQSEDINVNTNHVYDSMTVYANTGGFNTRLLTTDDELTLPQLTPVIVDDSDTPCINVRVNSMPPIVIPPISIGEVNIKDSNGNDILADSGTLRVSTISGFATSAAQTTAQASLNSLVTGTRILASNGNTITTDASNNLNVKETNSASIKTGIDNLNSKYLSTNTDSVNVYAGGENGLNIRTLTSTTDSVDVGLGTYTWSNRDPLFPASRDVLSVQLCGVDDLEGSNLINLLSDTNGALIVNTGLTSINIGNFPSIQQISGDVNATLVGSPSVTATISGTPNVNATLVGSPSVTATISGTPSVNATLVGSPSVSISGTPNVNATLVGTPSVTATISGTPDVNATLVGSPSVTATISGTPNVNATLVGSPSVSISGTPDVNATLVGSPSVTATISGTPSVNATLVGSPSVTATISGTPNVNANCSGSVNIKAMNGTNNPKDITCTPYGGVITNLRTSDDYEFQYVLNDQDLPILQTSVYNFPQTQTIEGTVNATLVGSPSVSISGTPNVSVTGSVSVTSLPTISITNTSFGVQPTTNYGIQNTFKNSMYDSTGSAITSRIPITDVKSLDTSSILYGKSGASSIAPITTTLNSARQELDVNMEKTDVHLYAKKPVSGNAMEVLNSDNHNHLAIRLTNDDESKYNTFDTNGGLNVHIKNTSIPVTTTLSGLSSSINIGDGVHNAGIELMSANPLYDETYGLSTKSVMCGVDYLNTVTPGAIVPIGTVDASMTVHVTNTVPISGNVGITGTVNASANIKDSSGNSITAMTSPSNVAGSLKIQQMGFNNNNYIDDRLSIYQGTTLISQSCFVSNSWDNPVSMGGYTGLGTQLKPLKVSASTNALLVGLDTAQNTVKLDTSNNSVKITDSDGDVATISTPSLVSGTSTIRALDTASIVNGFDVFNNAYNSLTMTNSVNGTTPNALYKALDTYVRNPSTTNDNGSVGLNTYVITPKQKSFFLNSFTAGSSGNAGTVCGFFNTTATLMNFLTFGAGKPNVRPYYFRATGVNIPGTVEWTAVNSSGAEVNGSTSVPLLSNSYQIGGAGAQWISINSFRVLTNKYPSNSNDQLFVDVFNSGASSGIAGVNSAFYATGLYTCPNGCIAYLTSFSGFCTAAETVFIMKSDVNGFRSTVFRFENTTNITGYAGNADGYVVLLPGESIYYVRNGTSGNLFLYGGIKQVYA